MNKIDAKHVNFFYGDFQALKDISMTIEEKSVVAFIGPSGCGKSTLLKIIAGFHQPTEGTAMMGDTPITGPSADRGVVFQTPTLYPWLNIYQNVEYGPKMRKVPKDEREAGVKKYLELVGLKDFAKQKPYELSGGMRQRVGIAMAMSFHPKLLLADEPTSALDVTTQATIVKEMMEVRKNMNIAIIIVTHNMGVAAYMADNIMVMKNGEVVEYGKAEEVIYHPKTDYVKMLLAAVPSLGGKTTA